MTPRRDLFLPVEPYSTGQGCGSTCGAHDVLGSSRATRMAPRRCSCTAALGPARQRCTAASSNPAPHWRIVIFDQRGGGRSTPLGETRDNSPDDLVADIERLREELGIARWMIFGGSWGSTLALHYAETHPDRCAGLVLRGIFLCRQSEIDWFLYGMQAVFPEAWRALSGFLPESERGDILGAYHRRLIDPDPRIHMPAARAWSLFEGACSTLLPNPETLAAFGEDRLALGLARIEAHFFNRSTCLPAKRDLIHRIDRIRHIPGVIVQGRYDMICPICSRRHARPRLAGGRVSDRARRRPLGDGARESAQEAKLVQATDRMKKVTIG